MSDEQEQTDKRSYEELVQAHKEREELEKQKKALMERKTKERLFFEASIPPIKYESELVQYMQQFILGQKEAINKLAFLGHLYSLKLQGIKHGIRLQSLPKLNILVTGPTGFGKTFMIKKFAEALGVKYKKIDLSSISAEGWKGTSLGEAIFDYLQQTPFGFGVLHLDEFDKIGKLEDSAYNDHKQEIQSGLLDLLEHDYTHFLEPSQFRTQGVRLNNANYALIILSGSFQSNRDIKKELDKKRPIGFNTVYEPEKLETEGWKKKLKELGFMRELVGRIVSSFELEKYSEADIMNILLKSKESALIKMGHLTSNFNLLDKDELDEIVSRAYESENGMRELDSMIFEKVYEKRKK